MWQELVGQTEKRRRREEAGGRGGLQHVTKCLPAGRVRRSDQFDSALYGCLFSSAGNSVAPPSITPRMCSRTSRKTSLRKYWFMRVLTTVSDGSRSISSC